MKLRVIMSAVSAFQKLANADMTLKSAYRLKKLVDSVQTEIDFFNEKQYKIIEKFGGGEGIVIPEDKLADMRAEIDELLELDVQTEFTPIKLPLTENVSVSASDITALSHFIEFTEHDTKRAGDLNG